MAVAAAGGEVTLASFLTAVAAAPELTARARGGALAGPSASLDGKPLYAKGAFEEETAPNLGKVRMERDTEREREREEREKSMACQSLPLRSKA